MKQIINFLKISEGWGRAVSVVVVACMLTALVTGCADHNDMFDSGFKVGNIVLSNNTLVSPDAFDAKTMKPVGVVFFTKNDSAWVIAPVELGDLPFSTKTGNVNGVSNDSYSLNGLTSTAAMIVSGDDMPAAEACANYSTGLSGWFLPSAGELRMLANNLDIVRRSMQVIGGEDFDNVQYMSSSQDNSSSGNNQILCYCVSLLRGYAVSVAKKEAHRVRPAILIH